MKKFMSGVITGAVVGSTANIIMNNNKPKKKESKTIGKTLHSLGDMADNITK